MFVFTGGSVIPLLKTTPAVARSDRKSSRMRASTSRVRFPSTKLSLGRTKLNGASNDLIKYVPSR